jgi:ligand-binding SRPBCC domain-containing protein
MRRLEFISIIPAPLDEVWTFFSSPGNLNKITPSEMNFRIITPLPEKMYKGMMIGYKVSPLPGLRLTWLTEITQSEDEKLFIDEQRKGPYKIWHHEHHFKEVAEGVEMRDVLIYDLPAGFIGRIVDVLLVYKRVKAIFAFREKQIKLLFHADKNVK